MVQDLSKDSLAAAIIARVTNSTFGPIGRNALQHRDSNNNARRRSVDLRSQQMVEQETPQIDGNGTYPRPLFFALLLLIIFLQGHLVFTTPSHTWQDYLNLRLSLEYRIRNQENLKPFPQDPVQTPQISRESTSIIRIYRSDKLYRPHRNKTTSVRYTVSFSSLIYS